MTTVHCMDEKLMECLRSGIRRWEKRKNQAMTTEAKMVAINYLDAYQSIAYQCFGRQLNDLDLSMTSVDQ